MGRMWDYEVTCVLINWINSIEKGESSHIIISPFQPAILLPNYNNLGRVDLMCCYDQDRALAVTIDIIIHIITNVITDKASSEPA